MVYLLHFEPPFKRIRHYAGATNDRRIFYAPTRTDPRELHVPLVDAAIAAGVTVRIARTWPTLYRTVAELPCRSHRAKLCPLCVELEQKRRRA